MMPMEPELINRPMENQRLYPSLSMAGSMILPTAMTVAGLEPEIAEKNIELVTVVMPSPPSNGRTSAFSYQPLGYSTLRHDIACEDEERDRHQRKLVNTGEQSLDHEDRWRRGRGL